MQLIVSNSSITDDHQWLILTKDNGYVYIYTFDGN